MREMKRSVKICAMLLALVLVIGGVAIENPAELTELVSELMV